MVFIVYNNISSLTHPSQSLNFPLLQMNTFVISSFHTRSLEYVTRPALDLSRPKYSVASLSRIELALITVVLLCSCATHAVAGGFS